MEMGKLLVIAIMLFGTANADVIMPDYHPVDHRLYIDNVGEYEEYQFFIYPTTMTGDLPESIAYMASVQIPYFYKFADAHLYAVKKAEMENKTPEEFLVLALKSKEALNIMDTLPDTDPRTEIETHYNVSIVSGELALAEVDAEEDQVGDVIVEDEGCEECSPERGLDYYLLVAGLGIGLVIGYLVGKKL